MRLRAVKQEVSQMRPNPKIFNESSKSGFAQFSPLQHKNGKPLSDVEYMCLLAERAEQIEAEHDSKNTPVNYGLLDRDVVTLAKKIKAAKDENIPESDILNFLEMCIQK